MSSLEFDLKLLAIRDLVDYLHTAVSEDDLLFVTYWLTQLKARQIESPGLLAHSWKKSTSLDVATTRPHSETRSLLLQSAKGIALLEMEAEAAENWISKSLPSPPEPLTGTKPLPPPPPPPPLSPRIAPNPTRLPSQPSPSDSKPSVLSFVPTPKQTSAEPPCRLFIGSLALQTTNGEIESALSAARVPILSLRILRCKTKVGVLFTVPSKKEMIACTQVLDRVVLHGKALFVERATPGKGQVNLFHVKVYDLPTFFEPFHLWQLLRPSRCGPSQSFLGYDSTGKWVGITRVETSDSAREAENYLKLRGYTATWQPDPLPTLRSPPSFSDEYDIKPNPNLALSSSPPPVPQHSRSRSNTILSTDPSKSKTSYASSLSPTIKTPPSSCSPPPLPFQLPVSSSVSRDFPPIESPKSPKDAYSTDIEIDTSFHFFSNSHQLQSIAPFSHDYRASFLPIDFTWNRQALGDAKRGRGFEELRRKRRKLV
ncbi:hypothetical protein JCM5350_002882 [Sporobolomyces pararoseus]